MFYDSSMRLIATLRQHRVNFGVRKYPLASTPAFMTDNQLVRYAWAFGRLEGGRIRLDDGTQMKTRRTSIQGHSHRMLTGTCGDLSFEFAAAANASDPQAEYFHIFDAQGRLLEMEDDRAHALRENTRDGLREYLDDKIAYQRSRRGQFPLKRYERIESPSSGV